MANEERDSVTVMLRQAGGTYAAEAGSPFPPARTDVARRRGFQRRRAGGPRGRELRRRTVTILLRQAGGGFAPEAGSPIAGAQASSVASGDFNVDGRPDLAVTNQNAGTVTILLRTATGGFAKEGAPVAAAPTRRGRVARLDSDSATTSRSPTSGRER